MTLTQFLLARYDEEASVAMDCEVMVPMGYAWRTISWMHGANRTHGRTWTPTRVLAECEGKRRIVKIHPVYSEDIGDGTQHDCPGTWVNGIDDPDEPCPTLRLLALPYADHPDFNPAWQV